MTLIKETILAALATHEPQSFEALLDAVHKAAPSLTASQIRGTIWSLLAAHELARTDEGGLIRLGT